MLFLTLALLPKVYFGGMAQASQPIISLNYGLKDFKIVHIAYQFAMWVAGCSGLLAFLLLALFSKPIIGGLVSSEPAVIAQGMKAIHLYFIAFAFTGFNTVLMYYFQSIERSFYSSVMSFLRGIGLIFILLLILPRYLGEAGIWLVLPVTEIITFIIFISLKKYFVKL